MEKFIIASIILERTTEWIKSKLPEKHRKHLDGLTISAALGIGFAVVYQMNLMEVYGFTTTVPLVGEVFTGIFLAGGAGGFNSLLEGLNNIGKPVVLEDDFYDEL